MPVLLQNTHTALSPADAERLWMETIAYTHHTNDEVTVRLVDEGEIRRLNREYRGKDAPTNVLTFNYGDGVHDIAVCLAVVEQEAGERQMDLRHYLSLVLVHGFLHAVGMDHDTSLAQAKETSEAEQKILQRAGFGAAHL